MAIVLTALSLPCPRCRDLTSNLMKSVDAFEVLLTGNAGIPAEILISTIRKIVTSFVATDANETAQKLEITNEISNKISQPQNHENGNSFFDVDVNSAPGENSEANNLDSDIDKAGNKQENLPDAQFEADSNIPLIKKNIKTGKRNRPARPKESEKTIPRIAANRAQVSSKAPPKTTRSVRQSETVSRTNPAMTPQQDGVETGSKTVDVHRRRPINNRPIATEQDFKQAAEYVKKLKVDTPDGLYYYLFECTQCYHQFPNLFGNRDAQRHIVGVHFDKQIVRKSRKTKTEIQLAPGKIRNSGQPTKVKLFGKRQKHLAGSKLLSASESSSRVIQIDSGKSQISSFVEKPETSVKTRRSRNRSCSTKMSGSANLGHPTSSSAPASSRQFPIPPNLTVRNPCDNFDLERTMDVLVAVKLTPNLANMRGVPSDQGQNQSTTVRTKIQDTDMINEDERTTGNEIIGTDSIKTEDNRPQVPGISPPND